MKGALRQSLSETTANVITAGSPVRLVGTETLITHMTLFPLDTNSGNIYVAFSSANAANGTAAVKLGPGSTYEVQGELDRNMQQYFDMMDFWIDADVSGDGVLIQYSYAKGNS